MIADVKSKKIVPTAHARGVIHDFKLYKESQVELAEEILELGDKDSD